MPLPASSTLPGKPPAGAWSRRTALAPWFGRLFEYDLAVDEVEGEFAAGHKSGADQGSFVDATENHHAFRLTAESDSAYVMIHENGLHADHHTTGSQATPAHASGQLIVDGEGPIELDAHVRLDLDLHTVGSNHDYGQEYSPVFVYPTFNHVRCHMHLPELTAPATAASCLNTDDRQPGPDSNDK